MRTFRNAATAAVRVGLITMIGLLACVVSIARAEPTNASHPQRTFIFTYTATITGLQPGQVARVWLPVPQSSADQTIEIVERALPGEPQLAKETKWGNQILFTESPARDDGTLPLR